MNVAEGNDSHADQDHKSHQANSQRNGDPLEAVMSFSSGHRSGDGVVFTVGSGEATGAEAGWWVSRDAHAGATIEAGSGQAGVGGPVAVEAFISRCTEADVVVNAIVACASIGTGVVCAVVDVDLAALASEARSTAAYPFPPQDQTQAT